MKTAIIQLITELDASLRSSEHTRARDLSTLGKIWCLAENLSDQNNIVPLGGAKRLEDGTYKVTIDKALTRDETVAVFRALGVVYEVMK